MSSLHGTGCCKNRLVVVLRVIRACSPRRCPRIPPPRQEKARQGRQGRRTASQASLGRFLAGSKRTRLLETGPVVGPAEAAAGHTHALRAGGVAPTTASSSASGGGCGRGPGSRAWVKGCHTCGSVLGASSTTSANLAREEGIKGGRWRRGLKLNSLPHSSSGRRVRSFAAGMGHKARACVRAESRPRNDNL